MMTTKIRGIFFDAGNTLLRVHPSVGEIYADAARRYGADLSAEAVEESFKKMWTRTGPLVTNEGHRLTYEKERDWWRFIVSEVFRDHIQFGNFDAFFDFLFERFAQSDCWRLYDDAHLVLQDLKQRGLHLGIISNWDSRLPSLLQQLDISKYFETVVVSSLVGYEKPHPAIFQIALDRSGLNSAEVIYIGDDPVLDYQAARSAGMRAFHLNRNKQFDLHEDTIDCLKDVLLRV
jgi:putative hydrolase of the HAD superfamily